MRILIAEDETVSRRVLKMTLESWGHEVIEARDGAVALQILQADTPPNLAIVHLSMPGPKTHHRKKPDQPAPQLTTHKLPRFESMEA